MNDQDATEAGHYRRLSFVADDLHIARFFLLLQQGVRIRRRVGYSVSAFMREELGVGSATLEKIQSIILNGKPVDDIGSALIHDGSVLALSAAMPGLVGATLRRGGAYSTFPSGITYHETGQACVSREGWVRIKLFNLLMAELGPDLLRRGVLLSGSDLLSFLSARAQELREGCRVALDGKPVDITLLRQGTALSGKGEVLLTVASGTVNA